jgi:NADH-quinone oxidoreductase subunit H
MSLLAMSVLAAESGDPIFAPGADDLLGTPLIVILVKVLVAFGVVLVCTALMIWYERKFIADLQNRVGPDRAGGKWGLLQTLADGTKLFFKEALWPKNAEKTVFRIAPYLSALPAFLTVCIIPLGGEVTIFGHRTLLQVAEPPVGVLFALMLSGIGVYGVMLAGWSSGSKYPLIGSVRASAQMVSYEAALGLSLAAVVLKTGSLSTQAIVNGQTGWRWNFWDLIFIPAIVFAIAATAELNRPPFDLVEAESELVGGFHTEYTSARFAMFYLAEFMNTITMSALITTLFLGGPNIPNTFRGRTYELPIIGSSSIVWLVLKIFILLSIYILLRATLPRYRYDQLMDLGWKRLIPASLLWLMLLAALRLERDGNIWERLRNLGLAGAGVALAAGLLFAAVRVGRQVAADEASGSGSPASPGTRTGRF